MLSVNKIMNLSKPAGLHPLYYIVSFTKSTLNAIRCFFTRNNLKINITNKPVLKTDQNLKSLPSVRLKL